MGFFSKAVLVLVVILPVAAHAQVKDLPQLKGYSPPSMFSGPPAAPAAPAAVSPAPPRAQPPQTIAPIAAQPPAADPIAAQPPPAPIPLPVPAAPAMQPTAPTASSGIRAEDLLNFPVAGDAQPPANPLAVPAAPVEAATSLPGSIPASTLPKNLPLPASVKKSETKAETSQKKPKEQPKEKSPKKAEQKQTAKEKTTVKKTEKRPLEKTKSVTKTEKKTETVQEKPLQKAAATPVIKSDKVEAVKVEPVKIDKPKTTAPETPKAKNEYRPSGSKTMPVATPKEVEREVLSGALPLPKNSKQTVVLPNMNERIIDQALEKNLVEPDVREIAKSTGMADTKAKLTEKTPAPTPVKDPVQTETVKSDLFSLEFKSGVTDLQPDQKTSLNLTTVPQLLRNENSRLQILAYAASEKTGSSSARRVSLSRGLSIRAYLLEKGVEPTRMDIRALGDQTNEKPVDRVDLLLTGQK